ncbi:MAG: twin-arginine translocase TatA/TatE family subunit [Nitrospirota bacterium]|nr:twin-arginine translocase TatA/TatE family subunit [Nitrospirota bacterium]MDP2384094.1 twin-arginine translocase TatA/TatE family subunit [Nitrospirota bacterium]MDP3598698.1 twin-arginine translocase TatA/TatE family subunit [Nitrospirota bacterium]
MFGTMGISELIIILVIVLIIFGAGKLPQIGEGVGKALKGFKKEVNEIPPQADAASPDVTQPEPMQVQPTIQAAPVVAQGQAPAAPKPTAPYTPGPELTPGTTAALMYNMAAQPQAPRPASAPSASTQSAAQGQQPPTMEERAAAPSPMMKAQYPPLPPGAQAKPVAKRPSAIVNKDAVARVQAQQAAMKAQAAQPAGISPGDMQSLGEGLGDALRTFKQAVADVRNSVDPEMRTIQAEMDSAQKEFQQSIEAAKEMPALHEEPPKQA